MVPRLCPVDSSGDQESQLLARAHEAAAAEDHASAVAHYRHLVALHPRCIYLVCLGLAFSDLGRHEEAEAAVREGLALEPDSWLAWRQLAWAFRDQGRMDEAFQACERSLAVKDDPFTRVLYAIMLRRKGETVRGLEQYEACVRNFPGHDEGWYGLGCALQEEDPERALRGFESALAIDPEDARYHIAVAHMHAKAGRLEPARVHAEEARRLGFVDGGFETLLETTLDWLRDVDRKYHPRTHRSRPARGDAAG